MARLRQPWRQRPSASDSNFRCRREEWFRQQNVTTTRLHRFLISVPDLRIDAGFSPFMPSCFFWGGRPSESKLSTAWPPKRNQHRVCDADSLIIWVLRWVRDSNPRSDRSLTCFRGRLLQPLGQLTLDRQISYKFLKYQSCWGNAFNFSNLAIYYIQSLEELQFRKWWILINPKTFVS